MSNTQQSSIAALEISQARYNFQQLRVRLGTAGEPLKERKARIIGAQIDRIKSGHQWIWTEQAVLRYEAKMTLKAA